MDHPSLPSKCFDAGSVLGSELGIWHPSLWCLAPLTSAPNKKVHQIKSHTNLPHVLPYVDHQGIGDLEGFKT